MNCALLRDGDSVSRRVLVVDDNVEAAEALAIWLEDLGHDVVMVSNGADALASARARRPDAVVCDIGLPDMSGYDLARELRADALFAEVRLIALTGYARPRDRELAQAAGFDLHFGKPVDPDALERSLGGAAR
jgi:CheY-like chemotaxis protein